MVDFPRIPARQALLHVLAFTVAFCSFVYELLYSELYKTLYGGTVLQYSLTIGIFFASLGFGAYLSRHLNDNRKSNFLRVEVYLALLAPVGFIFALWLGITGSVQVPSAIEHTLVRLPIFIIGLLSGFELPILFSMVDSEKDTRQSSSGIDQFEHYLDTACNKLVSIFFHTSHDNEEYST